MSVGRRAVLGTVVTGAALLAAAPAAQAAPDPCAVRPAVEGEAPPTPDPMCQSGMPVEEAAEPASLPRTGPDDRVLALTVGGAGLLLAGAGVLVAGRRRA